MSLRSKSWIGCVSRCSFLRMAAKKKSKKPATKPPRARRPYPRQVMVFFYDTPTLRRCVAQAEKADFEFALECADGDMKQAGFLVCIDHMPDNPTLLYGKDRQKAEAAYRKKHHLPEPPPPKPAKPATRKVTARRRR